MTITAKQLTAAELLELPDDGQRHELIAGELHSMPPTGESHGRAAVILVFSIEAHVQANNLGLVFVGETGYLLATDPDTVRAADVSFVRLERIEAEGVVTGYRRGAPDLVVEIVSPTDRYTAVEQKAAEWFAGGARMVVVVDPRRRTVSIRRSPTDVRVLTTADELDGEDVVPGWRLPVARLFGG